MSNAAFHENLERAEEVKGSSDRGFGLVFASVCGLIGGFGLLFGGRNALIWLGAGAVFLALALFAPRVLAPVNRLWLRFGLLLYRVMNPLVMAVLFFGLITPVSLLMRLFGKTPEAFRFSRDASTHWQTRQPASPDHSMRNQF